MAKEALKEAEKSEVFQRARTLLKDKAKLFDAIGEAMGSGTLGGGISIQDLDMRIVYESRMFLDLFGDHVGEFCYTIYERRDKLCEGCPIQEAYKTGKVHRALRVGITPGGPMRFENVGSVLKDKKGNIIAGQEFVRCVEPREKALDELREKTAKLEEFKKGATGRELEMVDLKNKMEENKKEIERLKARLGE